MESSGNDGIRLAVVGDVHLCWEQFDVDYFNGSDYDLVLFVGDIATYRHRQAIPILASISKLRIPALVIPGNHDAIHLGQLIAEALERPRLSANLAVGQARRIRQFDQSLGQVPMAGYSRHFFEIRGQRISIVAGRPHSMGGPRLAFRKQLQETYGIQSLEESRRRLCELVEQCDGEPIVFLAHNGPSGRGDRRDDIWGCDFRPNEGDFGDPDLEAAIAYARKSGRRVAAVIAGHMHHLLKGGGTRRWSEYDQGTLLLNAARVPRIFGENEGKLHHHVEVEILEGRATCSERLINRKAHET